MEKQIQAKTILHQTKQKFFKETAQRNSVIQKLEKEVKKDGRHLHPTAVGVLQDTGNGFVFFRPNG